MTRMLVFIVSFLLLANSLFAEDLMEYRQQKFNAGFLYTNVDEREYIGGKAHLMFGSQHSFIVGTSFLTFRQNQDINNSQEFWQVHFGYLHRKGNIFPFGEQTTVRFVGFFNGQSGQETNKGMALDYVAPYQIADGIFLSPFLKGRLETDPLESQGVLSWNLGFRLRFAVPDMEKMYVGVQLDAMKNISSYDMHGILPYQDIPVMGKVGGSFDYEWNNLLRYHVDLSGALFFQSGKYFEAKGSVELIQALNTGAYLSYRYNETTSNKNLHLFEKMWHFGVYVNF